MSFEQAGRYLGLLKDWKLLEENGSDNEFQITNRGAEFLSTFNELRQIIGNGKKGKLAKISE